MSVSSGYEFFWERPAAEFVCKFYSTLGSDLGVVAIDLMKYTWVSLISEVWSWRHWHGGCAHSLSWHIVSLEDKELTTDLAHDRQLLLSQRVEVLRILANIWQIYERKISLVFFWLTVYSVNQKKLPPHDFCQFLPNGWEFLIDILHTHYAFKYTIDAKFYPIISKFYKVMLY